MNRSELRAFFKDILNRTDCTDALADNFLSWGLRRAERVIRTPLQRQTARATVTEGDWPGYTVVPPDYIGLNYLRVNGVGLERLSPNSEKPIYGSPRYFHYEDEKIYFSPDLRPGDEIDMNYYAAQTFGEDNEVTPASLILSDVVVYAALVFAADHFVDERKPSFEETLGKLVGEVQAMADRDELVQGVIVSPYEGYI